ncbi:MAG: dTDP-4-dehydrorhamnose reductase [Blastocatellia bacterium]|jgi:dTDP-4-dehydrorhamnose reductase
MTTGWRVLLTGAGGQLGQAFLEADLPGWSFLACRHEDLDITDLGQVRQRVASLAPNVILNCAAYTAVDAAETDPVSAYRINATGPRNLALVAAEQNLPLVHISTDYVFDGRGERPYHEFDRPSPQSVYGLSKWAGEQAVVGLHSRHYLVRTAWLYHHQPLTAKNFLRTMLALGQTRQQEGVRVVSDQYGSPTYAPHLVSAIARLLATGAYGTYHFAGLGGTSWYELTRRFYLEMGVTTLVHPVSTAAFPRPAPRPRFSVLTTLQSPEILLPPWEEGVVAFARALTSSSSSHTKDGS